MKNAICPVVRKWIQTFQLEKLGPFLKKIIIKNLIEM